MSFPQPQQDNVSNFLIFIDFIEILICTYFTMCFLFFVLSVHAFKEEQSSALYLGV